MIHYSVNLIGNPRDPSQPKKAHARVQVNDVFDLQQFAEYIAKHNSKYNEGDIYAVLDTVGRHVRELVLMGYKVNLGKLGSFYPTVTSDGADSIRDFSVENIRGLHTKWESSKELRNMINDANFEQVITHAMNRKLLQMQNMLDREQEQAQELPPTSSNG